MYSLLNHSVTHCTRSSDSCLCRCVQLDDAQFYDESKRQDSSTKVRTFADHPCCETVCTILHVSFTSTTESQLHGQYATRTIVNFQLLPQTFAAFWATVGSNGLRYAAGLLSCVSVTLVYCGQTVGWIKMLLGRDVGLDPGDIVLDGDPAPSTERGTAAPLLLFDPLCSGTVVHLSNC